MIFEALITSQYTYGLAIYGTTSHSLINQLQKILNKALKTLFNNETKHTTKEIQKEYEIMNVEQTLTWHYITKHYSCNEHKITLTRSIRNNNNWLKFPKWRNSYGKRGMAYQIPLHFNKIPSELRHMQNPNKIKKEVKKWLLMN